MIKAGVVLLSSALLFLVLINPVLADGSSLGGLQIPNLKDSLQSGETANITKDNGAISNQLDSIKQELERIVNKKDVPWKAMVALLLGLAGIFKLQEYVDRKWLRKPVWDIDLKLAPPDSHKIALRNQSSGQRICDTYYFRFRVTNAGNYQMEDIEVMVEELYKKGRGSSYTKVRNFLPLNLVWAHNHLVTMSKIQPKLFKHCDFAHIVETNYLNLGQFGITTTVSVAMLLDTYVQPNTGSHIILPGKYKIKIAFAANNLPPKIIWFKLEFRDIWDNNEQQMLTRNVVIEKVAS
ncbi:hypothetical protein GW864_04485 [bacterium]|nr:hypothetical protein [bacterium]